MMLFDDQTELSTAGLLLEISTGPDLWKYIEIEVSGKVGGSLPYYRIFLSIPKGSYSNCEHEKISTTHRVMEV